MNAVSHMFSGIFVLHILSVYMPEHYSKTYMFILLSAIFAVFPDLDLFWSKSLKDHHDTAFHMPFFWAVVTAVFLVLGLTIKQIDPFVVLLFFIQVFFHLFLDFVTARFAGIKLLYPLSHKKYSMFKLRPQHGNLHVFRANRNLIEKYLNYYFRNKTLITFEASFVVMGIIVLI